MRSLVFGCSILVSMFLFAVNHPAVAQTLPDELQNSLQQLADGQPRAALMAAETYIEIYPGGEYVAAANILAGRASMAMQLYDNALEYGQRILSTPAMNPMAAQAHYLVATALQARGDTYEAARELVESLNLQETGTVAELASSRLAELLQGPLLYRVGILRDLARSDAARHALANAGGIRVDQPRFGVVVPNTEQDTLALAMLQGVQAAVALYNRNHDGPDVLLEVENETSGALDAVQATRTLTREKGAWGFVFGGQEEDVIAATVEAQAAGVPCILPGQRKPGLFSIGPGVLQPEASWYREGEITALYAADSLNLETFAVVAPVSEQGREIVGGFTDALSRREDTEIVTVEWYFPDEGVSIDRQFKRIRRMGFRRDFADSLRQNYIPFDSTEFEELWETHLDSIRRSLQYRIGAIDSNAIAVKDFDALYFVIESNTIELFAPQFAFYNFDAQIFGNSAWYEPTEIYRHRQYLEDWVITAPYYLQDDNNRLSMLTLQLARDQGVAVTPWHIRGFDAASVLLAQVESGRLGPRNVADGIRTLSRLDIAAGQQYFSRDRHEGLGIWFLTIHEGNVEPENVARRKLQLTPPPPPPVDERRMTAPRNRTGRGGNQ